MAQGNAPSGVEPSAALKANAPDPIAPIPRLALTREAAAAAIGMSLDSFERHVQPHVRLLRLGRMRLVAVSELERFCKTHAEHVLEPRRVA